MRAAGAVALVALAATLAIPVAAAAQARRTSPTPRTAERQAAPARMLAGRDARIVRAEYAAVLLQGERYDEAAHEYRTLLATDSTNAEWRLGLARAYAWGGRSREAERELLALRAEPRTDPAVEPLLRAVRASLRPRPDQAIAWMAEDPAHAPYRLSLARAYVRQRRPALALAHFDTLLAPDSSAALLREAGAAYYAAGDTSGGLQRIHRSLAIDPSADGWVLIGDLRRASGDHAAARDSYERARALSPGDRAIATALVRLSREERPPVRLAGAHLDAYGWQARGESVRDNTGIAYSTLSLRRGAPVASPAGGELTVGGGVELRRMEARDVATAISGAAIDAGLSYERWYGSIGARLVGRGGVAFHDHVGPAPLGEIGAAVWIDAWELSFSIEAAPAYPELLTIGSLVEPDPRASGPLGAHHMTAGVAGALGAADLALAVQQTDLGDGNRRSSVQGFARHPVSDRVAVLYSLFALQAEEPSDLYWAPADFLAHSLGAELAQRRTRGLSYSARLLAGAARSEEIVTSGGGSDVGAESTRTLAPQLSASGEVAWRGGGWEVAAGAGYGRGRDGGYERASASLSLRLIP